ncbi:hypothetical protein ACW9HQ_53130, partial [Nocardia gipuzkoensis]
ALPHLLQASDTAPLLAFLREVAPRLVFLGDGAALFDQLERNRHGIASGPFLTLLRAAHALERDELPRAVVELDELFRRPATPDAIAPSTWIAPMTVAVTAGIALATRTGITDFRAHEPPATTGHSDIDAYVAIQIGTVLVARGDIVSGAAHLRRGLTLADCAGNPRLAVRA